MRDLKKWHVISCPIINTDDHCPVKDELVKSEAANSKLKEKNKKLVQALREKLLDDGYSEDDLDQELLGVEDD